MTSKEFAELHVGKKATATFSSGMHNGKSIEGFILGYDSQFVLIGEKGPNIGQCGIYTLLIGSALAKCRLVHVSEIKLEEVTTNTVVKAQSIVTPDKYFEIMFNSSHDNGTIQAIWPESDSLDDY